MLAALDVATGDERWSIEGHVAADCGDYVVAFTPMSDGEAFSVLDQHTGDERWTSDSRSDWTGVDVTCGGRWVYMSDGESVRQVEAVDGALDWETPVANAGALELFGEVALVRSTDGATTIGVEREEGAVLWTRPSAEVGYLVSAPARLRRDSRGALFVMHARSGNVARRMPAGTQGDKPVVVGVSDTRVVTTVGSVVTTYGLHDLGVAWTLDVGGRPDEVGVADEALVVRSGSTIVAYR